MQALEFVLGIDEQLYENLVPKKLKKKLESMAELPLPLIPSLDGLDGGALCRFAITFVFLVGITLSCLMPQRDFLVEAQDALCGGNLDFVFTTDGGGTTRWAATDSSGEEPTGLKWASASTQEQAEMDFQTRLVDALIAGQTMDDSQGGCGLDIQSLEEMCVVESSLVANGTKQEPSECCWTKMEDNQLEGGGASCLPSSYSHLLLFRCLNCRLFAPLLPSLPHDLQHI